MERTGFVMSALDNVQALPFALCASCGELKGSWVHATTHPATKLREKTHEFVLAVPTAPVTVPEQPSETEILTTQPYPGWMFALVAGWTGFIIGLIAIGHIVQGG